MVRITDHPDMTSAVVTVDIKHKISQNKTLLATKRKIYYYVYSEKSCIPSCHNQWHIFQRKCHNILQHRIMLHHCCFLFSQSGFAVPDTIGFYALIDNCCSFGVYGSGICIRKLNNMQRVWLHNNINSDHIGFGKVFDAEIIEFV